MKRLYSNVSSAEIALEQTPEVLKAIGMHSPVNVLLGVVHDVMHVTPVEKIVSRCAVGIDGRAILYLLKNLCLQSVPLHIGHYFGANFTSVTIKHSDDSSFTVVCSGLLVSKSAVFVHIERLPADIGFVHFNAIATSTNLEQGLVFHGNTNAMQHEPCGLLSYADGATNFVAAHAVLAIAEHPHNGQPFFQRDRRILKNGSNLGAELPMRMDTLALPLALILEEHRVFALAMNVWASDTIRPQFRHHVFKASVGVGVVEDGLLKGAWLLHIFHLNQRTKGHLICHVYY